ncbi:YgfZ/GcvT domain-containing protein [Denitrobaculum tricleocarpae]|uniref:Folate-binding protein YgfZ n=1 Tax=Denitrobaculum tricleocarpae TaxID=2591009 RepID=A0A545TXH5_9PROT|nr:folate-binding protein YgfZ [Denitrobaculum tricleocarpae]TQV81926.1 folate-binding protein YgfZ [Denitrobaculum tricleocarpae]
MPDQTKPRGVILSHRGVLRVSGPDRVAFLQGLVSNDVEAVSSSRSVWAAFLTPQGKFLHEFFVTEEHPGNSEGAEAGGERALLIDCEAGRRADLQRRLKLYKLRSQVQVEDAQSDYCIAALFGEEALSSLDLEPTPGSSANLGAGRVFVDPRMTELGARAILPSGNAEAILRDAGFETASRDEYDCLRSELGVPDGSRDLEVEKSTLLENGFDELHGVDWDKGCYMGQELTARTKYRGLVKKRLLPAEISGPTPEPGTPLLSGNKEVGIMRSAVAQKGLATVRLDALQDSGFAELRAGEAQITVRKPVWMHN